MKRPGTHQRTDLPASDGEHGSAARRWLLALWVGVALNLLGQVVDIAWHANHGPFRTASDQVEAHWLDWLGIAVTIGVCLGAASSGKAGGRGYLYVLAASVVFVLASGWVFWGHAHGEEEPLIPHAILSISRLGILAAAFYTTHLVIGREQHPGLFRMKGSSR